MNHWNDLEDRGLADNDRSETREPGERSWLVELVDALRVSRLDHAELLDGEHVDVTERERRHVDGLEEVLELEGEDRVQAELAESDERLAANKTGHVLDAHDGEQELNQRLVGGRHSDAIRVRGGRDGHAIRVRGGQRAHGLRDPVLLDRHIVRPEGRLEALVLFFVLINTLN